MQKPLTARPLDFVYFIFFVFHLPASLLVDCQTIVPPSMVPSALRRLVDHYVQNSSDPLIGGLLGHFGDNSHLLWFKTLIYVEMLFQVPVFVLGANGLWTGSEGIYPLLLAYAASTATSTLPCVVQILSLSVSDIPRPGTVTVAEKILLLAGYVPFFLIPLFMAFDMALRLSSLASRFSKLRMDTKMR